MMVAWSELSDRIDDAPSGKMTNAVRIRKILLQAIGEGTLPAGARIIEKELGEALSVSRTPLREALSALRSEQIVERDEDGLRVRKLAWQDVRDLYEMRGTLEGMAARLAARHASASECQIIANLCEEEATLIAKQAEPDALSQLNKRFHNTILQAAGNQFLSDELRRLSRLTLLLGSTVYSLTDRLSMIQAEHLAITNAICAKDEEAAEAEMRAHLSQGLAARLMIMAQIQGPELD